MPISSGLFNNTLTLQTLTETVDGMGGVTQTWADTGSFRARISPLSSQERLVQDKTTSATTHRIYCDNIAITTANRIRYDYSSDGYVYFEILGIINPSEAYEHLEIEVREIL